MRILIFCLILVLISSCNSEPSKPAKMVDRGGFKGAVKEMKKARGGCFITLDTVKIFVSYSYNFKYSPYNFCDLVKIGDTVYMNDPTFIYVKRNEREYVFKPSGALNEHLDKRYEW